MLLKEYRAISKDIDNDIREVFKKYGLNLDKRTAKVDEFGGTVKYTVTLADANLKDADGKDTTPEREHWKNVATYYGLKPEWLDKTVVFCNGTFTITGLGFWQAQRNVLLKRADGEIFVCSPSDIKARMPA